jgi:hypothetical protein
MAIGWTIGQTITSCSVDDRHIHLANIEDPDASLARRAIPKVFARIDSEAGQHIAAKSRQILRRDATEQYGDIATAMKLELGSAR